MAAPAVPPATVGGRGRWRDWWPLALVLLALAFAAVLVPTLTPVATTDDWGYTRSAQILVAEGRLVIFPVVAATAIVPVVWSALFGWVFEPTLGVFRLATVVMVGIGTLGVYGLSRELGLDRGRSALGAAATLFNPLSFVLAFTSMTDPYFVACLVLATWGYVRGLQPARPGPGWVIVGSALAGLALLCRQQGVLIPVAVVAWLLLSRRLRVDRASVALVLQVVALPILTGLGYVAWLRFGNDVPAVQTSFLQEMLDEGWAGTWWLAQRLSVVILAYLGFFALPVAVAALGAGGDLWRGMRRRGWVLALIWAAVLLVGVIGLWQAGARMPYIGQFFGAGGLGPPDVRGSRPRLLTADLRAGLTIICVAASLVLALLAGRAIGRRPVAGERLPATGRAGAGLVLSVALWQVIGVFPPSYHYIGWTAGSLDRYLLPLIPLTIVLALWALPARRWLAGAWVVVAFSAVFAIAGTRDYLVYLRGVWSVASTAVAAGVPLDQLDAGAAWDGYYLYEYSLAHLDRGRTRGGPWWVYFYGRATDSSYIVTGKPDPGYVTVWEHDYPSLLLGRSVPLYLQRRPSRSWPPTGQGSLLQWQPVRVAAPELVLPLPD